jgi:TonB family protein
MSKYIALAALLAAFPVVRAQDTDAANLIQQAEQAIRHTQFARADTLYAQAASLGDRPEIAPALWYLGNRALGAGNRLAAEGFFERLMAVDPKGPLAGRAITSLANLRPPDDALAAESLYKQALAIEEPGSIDARDTLGAYTFFLRKHGRAEEAEALQANARQVAQQGPVFRTGGSRPPAQTTALPKDVFRVGNGVTAPALVRKVEPEYTEGARIGKLQGTTVLGVDIGPDGVARDFEILRSLEPGLDQKAIDAVQQWQFRPGTKDGVPVTVRATIEVNFRLL